MLSLLCNGIYWDAFLLGCILDTPLSPLPIGKYWPVPLSLLAPRGHSRPVFLGSSIFVSQVCVGMAVMWRNALGLPVPCREGTVPVVLDCRVYLGILTFIPQESTQGRHKVPYTYNLLILSEHLNGAWVRGDRGWDQTPVSAYNWNQ